MPESVLASPLADGSFDGVAAASGGTSLAFASQAGQGVNTGLVWDLASRAVLGPPIPDFPADRADWTFGVPVAGTPLVAWTHRDRVHVQGPGSGHELVIDGQPDMLGLAAHGGRGAVVAVFGPANDARVAVWDALSGDRLAEFALWLGHGTAIDRSILHAAPASGPLVALAGEADVLVLDVERGEDIAALPFGDVVLAASARGPVLVQPARNALHVRCLNGDWVAVLTVPGPCRPVAAAGDGRSLLVAAALEDDPCTILAWDVDDSTPSHDVKVPAPVAELALSPDGTLLAATDDGLYTARLRP
ncbi:hypothetical protein ACFOY4_27410 [Actinomadura syzygii]|uniref:WD40 repeat domain-containing protein n=1 Tax=Actinomadura syzygii TaxID=1427538 RepID=A0A5D0UHW9_9ACTN|nr:hypothetical protein [Actinomadura syzygii]TYC17360.1 hypothetical protein FXF65_04925 [Actinomadura syzygii]